MVQDYLTIGDAFQLISKFPQIDQFHIHWLYLWRTIKVTVSIGQSDDVLIKQWDIYILLATIYNGTPEPMITQLLSVLVLVLSEILAPQENTASPSTLVLFLCIIFLSLFLVK